MELNLNGKCAIVTGGSAGIGLACATGLAAEGVGVLIAARDKERLKDAAERIRAAADHHAAERSTATDARVVAIGADLTEAADVRRLVEETMNQFGRIDILINNAGSAVAGAFTKLPDTAFLEAWQLKLLGYIRMVHAAIPHMKEFAIKLLGWKHSGFSIDNSVRILDREARTNLAEYISRPPISLKKIRYEPFKGRVLFHTKYSEYFRPTLALVENCSHVQCVGLPCRTHAAHPAKGNPTDTPLRAVFIADQGSMGSDGSRC